MEIKQCKLKEIPVYDYVQVTEENAKDVYNWCGGDYIVKVDDERFVVLRQEDFIARFGENNG